MEKQNKRNSRSRRKHKNSSGRSKNEPSEKKIVNIVKSIVNQDKQLKWIPNDSGIISSTTSLLIYDITSAVSQGITATTRVGTSIRLKRLKVRLSWVTGDITQLVRFFIFRWIPSSTSDTPTASELQDITGNAVMTTFLDYRPSRFKILYDRIQNLDTYNPTHYISFDLPLDFVAEFDIGVNTGRNHLYAGYASDSGAVPHPTIEFLTQLSWHDTE